VLVVAVILVGRATSSGAQPSGVGGLTIVAVANPGPSALLHPGGRGDVVVSITNPNVFPVTISAVQLPTETSYATGHWTSDMGAAKYGCGPTSSLVSWSGATAVDGSSHRLATPLTVAANGTLVVVFSDEASMGASSPSACEDAYFSMPSLRGVSATVGSSAITRGPARDSWSGTAQQPTPRSPLLGQGPVSSCFRTPHPNGGRADDLFTKVANVLGRYAGPIGKATAFMFILLPFIIGFLLLQRRLDANEPKLASAPVYSRRDLEFSELDEATGPER
jgi:hypothetical protein